MIFQDWIYEMKFQMKRKFPIQKLNIIYELVRDF